jgi:hypothetical protein
MEENDDLCIREQTEAIRAADHLEAGPQEQSCGTATVNWCPDCAHGKKCPAVGGWTTCQRSFNGCREHLRECARSRLEAQAIAETTGDAGILRSAVHNSVAGNKESASAHGLCVDALKSEVLNKDDVTYLGYPMSLHPGDHRRGASAAASGGRISQDELTQSHAKQSGDKVKMTIEEEKEYWDKVVKKLPSRVCLKDDGVRTPTPPKNRLSTVPNRFQMDRQTSTPSTPTSSHRELPSVEQQTLEFRAKRVRMSKSSDRSELRDQPIDNDCSRAQVRFDSASSGVDDATALSENVLLTRLMKGSHPWI